jgi:hypothetical protein
MSVDRFPSEVTLDVEVEVLEATRATRGRPGARPEESSPAEPAQIALAVWLQGNESDPAHRIDLVPWLPVDVLEALTSEALDRLRDD